MTHRIIKVLEGSWCVFAILVALANFESALWYLIAGVIGVFVFEIIRAPFINEEREKEKAAELKARQDEQQRQEKKLICPKCGRKNTTFHKELTDEYEYGEDHYEIDSGVSVTRVIDQITYQKIRFYRKCESCSTIYDNEGYEMKEVERKEISRKHHYTG